MSRRSSAPFRLLCAALASAALVVALGGCATLPSGKPDPRDPYERMNRSIYKFNTAVDHAVLRPVARTYVKVIPRPVRTSVNNFVTNLAYPTTVVNSFLEGKIGDGVSDTARLVVNTTIGIGGLFDPASNMGLDRHDADFGLTLAKWGIRKSPYLMLPLLGPSTVRDGFGRLPDWLLLHEIETIKLFQNNNYVTYSLFVVSVVNLRAQLLEEDKLLDSAYDPYALLRSAYLQRRDYLINNGQENPEEEFPDAGPDSGADAAPDAATPSAAPGEPGTAPGGTPAVTPANTPAAPPPK
ncbi:MAG TPA: VacJ family lipoprotein [Steroidobacteraceae bacterium]|jgi:phospholipid-binding lipoprotein MlaA